MIKNKLTPLINSSCSKNDFEYELQTYTKVVIKWNIFCIPKALIITFHPSFLLQNNPYEFTAQKHKFKRLFCTQNPVWNVNFNISGIQK